MQESSSRRGSGWACVRVSICQRTYVAARKFADYEGRARYPNQRIVISTGGGALCRHSRETRFFKIFYEYIANNHPSQIIVSKQLTPKQKRVSIPELQSKGKASDLPSLAFL